MGNEELETKNQEEQGVQDQATSGTADAPAPPADLAEAFAQIRAANASTAEDGVDGDEGDEKDERVGKHARIGEEPGDEPAADAAADEAGQGAGEDLGGNAVGDEPIDYSPAKQQIYQRVNQQAIENVAKKFQENGIRMWEIGDLFDKDEQTGRVVFKNPDDESRPFQSRKEAQDFVDAMNKQIQQKFRSEIQQEQRNLMNQAVPSLSMLDFVPVYQNMNDSERRVFDQLITPYAIRDANGNITGFNDDLMNEAEKARAITAMFSSKDQEKPVTETTTGNNKVVSEPAVDMNTGTGESGNDEPKTLEEAFAMLRKKEDK